MCAFSLKGQLIETLKAKEFLLAIALFRRIHESSDIASEDESTEETDAVGEDSSSGSKDDVAPLSKEGKVIFNGIKKIFFGESDSNLLICLVDHICQMTPESLQSKFLIKKDIFTHNFIQKFMYL